MKGLALAALCVVGASCRHAESEEAAPVIAVHCQSPTREAVSEVIAVRGRLQPPPGGDLPVASQVAGRVVRVEVKEGQHVAMGAVLATVDGAASESAVKQADAAVAQARASESNASATLERTRTLLGRGIAAKQEVEDATARADAAKATLAAAVASADLARKTLGRVAVRSSLEGVVTRIWRGPGALVDGTSATPIAQVAASSRVELLVDVTDRDLAKLEEGQSAKGTLSGSDEPITGTVLAKSMALDPVTSLGVVRIALDPEPKNVAMGTFGRMVVTVGHRDGVLVLPTTALRGAVSDGSEIAICKDKKAEIRVVKVGFRDAQRFEVLEGATTEDKVAIDHVLGLETGTPIDEAK